MQDVSFEGLWAWVAAVPGTDGVGVPGHQRECGHLWNGLSHMCIYICAHVSVGACVRMCVVCVCLQSRKHCFVLLVLSLRNKSDFVTDNTFLLFVFLKKGTSKSFKNCYSTKKCVCVCVYLYIYMYIYINQK